MIKALLLIFAPMATWDGIAQARRSLRFVLGVYLLPMLLLVAAVNCYGLVHWGKWQGEVGRLKHFSVGEAVVIEAASIPALAGRHLPRRQDAQVHRRDLSRPPYLCPGVDHGGLRAEPASSCCACWMPLAGSTPGSASAIGILLSVADALSRRAADDGAGPAARLWALSDECHLVGADQRPGALHHRRLTCKASSPSCRRLSPT